jgi:NTE family protein
MKKILSILCIFLLSSCQHKNIILYDEQAVKNVDIVVVLGGGGAKAIADLGVFEVLEDEGIKVDLIVGTSGGSIFGALYADNPDAKALKSILEKLKLDDFVDFSVLSAIRGIYSLTSSYADSQNIEKFLKNNMNTNEFQELKIPLVIATTDLMTGEIVPINQGKISEAVRASCAIPGLFSPVKIGNNILVDGAVAAPLAISVAREYHPKIVIAVDISSPLEAKDIKNVFDVMAKSFFINYSKLNERLGAEADILIKPHLSDIGLFDAHRKDELYAAGKKATLAILPKLKALIKKRSYIPRSVWNRL